MGPNGRLHVAKVIPDRFGKKNESFLEIFEVQYKLENPPASEGRNPKKSKPVIGIEQFERFSGRRFTKELKN